MIIESDQVKKLQEFIFNNPGIDSDEVERCQHCWHDEETFKCKDYDICKRYTPNYLGMSGMEGMINLVQDLFDTIEHLVNQSK